MPVYDYRCKECGKTYDVFHKGREKAEDVVCPHCGSLSSVKLMSAPMIAVGASGRSEAASPSCCCNGACEN